ncbi:related to Spindle pole body assembly component MPS3 [Zygosaccharomyces bailii ISA1307]|nr:related to Spindle pole body assembly component MPS3 [Zygosaccharomyces bailii ISA1307]
MDKNHSDGYLYNKSLKSAYKDLLMEKMGRQRESWAVENEGTEEALADMSNYEGYEVGEDQVEEENEESINDENYLKFKKSLVLDDNDCEASEMDDAWLDETSTVDGDYTNEADRSFYGEEAEEAEDDTSDEQKDESEQDNDYYEYSEEEDLQTPKYGIFRLVLFGMVLLLFLFAGPIIRLFPERTVSVMGTPSSMTNLQKQINHLYSELNHRDDQYKTDFDKTIKVVITQFEKNIKKLLPSNFIYLQSQLESLTKRVNNITHVLSRWEKHGSSVFSMENVTEWQQQLVHELESQLPQEIPVVVNSNSSVLVIPELHNYLIRLTTSLIQHSHPPEQPLEYDLNFYVKEILANQFQYIEKEYFINELNRNLQLNKQEIWEEMERRFNQLENEKGPQGVVPQQYSTILLKKLINQIYNNNQHQWEDDLDFATLSQGTKLLNHLTSPSLKNGNGVNPMELLQESKNGPSTYWQCGKPAGCSWAIRFKDPVFLTKLFYLHGRFRNNLQMMNSAPKVISVYVRLANNDGSRKLVELARSFKQGKAFPGDSQHILIGQYSYSLTDNKIRQSLSLPTWFIQLKPLVRSLVFQVDENHGNRQFTSLRKFIVNAVTQQDLQIMETNSFPVISNEPEYASSTKAPQLQDNPRPAIAHNSEQDVLSFGQDEPDI